MAAIPTQNQPAPPLAGPTDRQPFNLGTYRGHLVVVYFYPKDMTSGCATEARGFEALAEDFAALGVQVVGVSKDSPKRHARFRDKESLGFPLVSDEDGSICEAWGVWQEKKNYGRTYMGIVRSTFLVDPEGRIAQVWPKVRVKGHVEAVLEAARALSST